MEQKTQYKEKPQKKRRGKKYPCRACGKGIPESCATARYYEGDPKDSALVHIDLKCPSCNSEATYNKTDGIKGSDK